LSAGRVELATNRVSVTVCDDRQPNERVVIQLCEKSGWIIAGVTHLGWLCEIPEEDRNVFRAALAGLYALGAVGLVHEQIESRLVAAPLPPSEHSRGSELPKGQWPAANSPHPYDISADGLVVWPYRHYESAVHYPLDESPTSAPRPRSLARAAGLTPLPVAAIVFREHSLFWADWSTYWETEQVLSAIPIRLLPGVELLKKP
jgi:hypothetical protein